MLDVLEVRGYARLKQTIEEIDARDQKSAADYPSGAMAERVQDNQFRIAREKMKSRKNLG